MEALHALERRRFVSFDEIPTSSIAVLINSIIRDDRYPAAS